MAIWAYVTVLLSMNGIPQMLAVLAGMILAGSIRDDVPLPEVITDTAKAKDAMYKALRGVDMTVMLGTMLDSIAVGSLLPSYAKPSAWTSSPSL